MHYVPLGQILYPVSKMKTRDGDGRRDGREMAGDMAGDMAGMEPSCQDEFEEDDSQAQASPGIFDRFSLYNFCDDAFDWLSFELDEGESIDIETYSVNALGINSTNETDTVLSIHDSTGMVLAEDDDGGSGRASRIMAWTAPSSATYAARVRSYGSSIGEELAYRLILRQACDDDQYEVLDSFLNESDARSQLQDDRPLTENLLNEEASLSLPLAQERTLCDEDWLTFVIDEEDLLNSPSLILQTEVENDPSRRADTILSLYGPNGDLIAENDDRNNSVRSSYIELSLSPESVGRYWQPAFMLMINFTVGLGLIGSQFALRNYVMISTMTKMVSSMRD